MTKTEMNKYVRRGLRLLAFVVLLTIAVFRWIIPVIKNEEIFMKANDGYVVGGCFIVLLAVESVRALALRAPEGIWNKFFNSKK